MTYRILIPIWKPTSDNKLISRNRFAAAKLKKGDAEMIAAYAASSGIPKATTRRRVTITVTVCKGRSPDPENFKKSIHDALVKCGMLVDDSYRWLESAPAIVHRGQSQLGQSLQTEITLEDIEDLPEPVIAMRNRRNP